MWISFVRGVSPLFGVLGFSLVAACGSEQDPPAAAGGAAAGGAATGGVAIGGAAAGGTPAGGAPVAGATAGGAPAGGAPTANAGSSAAGGGGAPSAGQSGSGGSATGGSGGASAAGGTATGAAGMAGAGAGGTATGGRGGVGGGGAGGTGGTPAKSATCPAGPFPTPMVTSSKTVCQNYNFAYSHNEGPAWIASQKAFFFTNFVAQSGSGGDIIKYTPGGDCEVFIRNVGCNGLAPGIDGSLLGACQQTRSIVRFDVTTKQATTVADTYMGKMLDTPNDLVQHSNGTIYFTNPPNELDGRPVGAGRATFRVDPSGTVIRVGEGDCNGIALSPDEKKLYVILSNQWDLDAQGVPSNPRQMFTRGDGVAVDCAGNVYANGSIFSASGSMLGSWGAGTNLAFGGEDGTTVLVAGPGRTVRELKLNVPGPP